MKIGELSEITGISTETIRYYEKAKLLQPADRSHNNYRIYNQNHLDRLQFIKNCRAFDMAHDEIHELLMLTNDSNCTNCREINRLIKSHLIHIETRIKELSILKQQLTEIERKCGENHLPKSCSIIKELSQLKIDAQKTTHLG